MNTYFDLPAFIFIMCIVAFLVLLLGLIVYVGDMSIDKGRNTLYWILFSLVFTPILGMILLACLGETKEKRRERMLKDDEYLRMMRD